MAKKQKILLAFIAAIILFFLLIFFVNKKIEDEIENAVLGIIDYEEIEISVLGNNLLLKNPKIEVNGKNLEASEIKLEGFNFYDYLFNDKIVIDKLILQKPEINIITKDEDSVKPKSTRKFEYDILVHSIHAKNGIFSLAKNDSVTKDLFIAFENFGLKNVAINAVSIKNDIPFNFSAYNFAIDSLNFNLDDLHFLTAGKATAKEGEFSVKNLKITPKFNKIEFQRHIPFEKDRFIMKFKEITSDDFSWNILNDTLQFESPLLVIANMDLEVYRNKLLPDDTSIKDLYSTQIRNLPIKIDFEEVQIKNSSVVYEEKTNQERPPLKLIFDELDATISNLSNINLAREDFPETKLNAKAFFMSSSPVELDWSFNIGTKQPNFHISGTLGSLSSEVLNSFLTPALNVRAEGGINATAFNYAGDENMATGEMRLDYDHFKFEILQKDENKVNEFLSAIANIFIKNEGTTGNITQKELEVERNNTKSFWNYLWLMVKKGVLKVFL